MPALLDVPTWGLGDEEDLADDEDGHQQLEYDDQFPVPFAEALWVLGGGEADPVRNEGTDRVEHLPERHDLSTDLRRGEFTDVDGASSWRTVSPERAQT